ncbi:MAG: phosphate permease [Legionellales bacterium]|nr:phosphate permease [Legionellales bacterium]OUX64872.1 MAG: hypothetical protein CBE41_02555 [Gammaproteobacteria bacterium TMED281]
MDNVILLTTLSIMFGFIMAWAVGANDVANAMGTSVGAGVLTIQQAIVLAGVFEVLGALLASDGVTNTLSKGLVHLEGLANADILIVYGMLSALAASATWLIFATAMGWPVSTTHSIVGAILGYGWFVAGTQNVNWHVLISIFSSWVITPTLSALLSAGIFISVQQLILNHENPDVRAKTIVPMYLFIVSLIIVYISLSLVWMHTKGSLFEMVVIACSSSILLTVVGYGIIRKVKTKILIKHKDYVSAYNHVEQMFGVLAIFTASAMAFAHGGNDVANAIGPLARIIITLHPHYANQYPYWVTCIGALGVVLGLSMYGYKIIKTVGNKITALTPIRGFSAQFSTAFVVVTSSAFGLPISTTHTLVGAVIGVGIVGGLGALDTRVIKGIFSSWFITLPIGAALSIIYFLILAHVMHFQF